MSTTEDTSTARRGSECNALLGQASEALHVAVCQAVALLNRAPEVARCTEGREARDLLRQALADYADAYMDEPAPESQRAAVAAKHQSDAPVCPWCDRQGHDICQHADDARTCKATR